MKPSRRWRVAAGGVVAWTLLAAVPLRAQTGETAGGGAEAADSVPRLLAEIDPGVTVSACGEPAFQIGGWAFWPKGLARFAEPYGGWAYIGLKALGPSDWEVSGSLPYALREDRLGYVFAASRMLAERSGWRVRPASWLRSLGGQQDRGVSARAEWAPHGSAWEAAAGYVALVHERFAPLRGRSAREWEAGESLHLDAYAAADLGASLWGRLRGLSAAVSARGGWASTEGGPYRPLALLQATVLYARDHGAIWLRRGASLGSPPPNYHYDLGVQGRIVSEGTWAGRGPAYVAAGAAGNIHVVEFFHAGAFTTYASLLPHGRSIWEAGPFVGRAFPRMAPNPRWRSRLDVPLYRREGRRDSWGFRRVVLRFWLWPGPAGFLSPAFLELWFAP